MNITNISNWIKTSNTIGGSSVSFVIEFDKKRPYLKDISSNIFQLYGYKKEDLLNKKECVDDLIYKNDLKFIYLSIQNFLLKRERTHKISFRILTADKSIKLVECFFTFKKDKKRDTVMLFGYILDNTIKKAYEDEINYLYYYDQLTDLANRRKIKNEINKEIESHIYANTSSAVLFLGLNRFKNINDSLGYEKGDKLLQHVAHRLKSCVKDIDTLARIGGDEFVILLSGLKEKTIRSQIEIIAKRINTILEQPFKIGPNSLHITISIGAAIIGADGNNSNKILKNADSAMKEAKKDQNIYLSYYKSTMQDRALTNLEIENDLRVAIKEGEFELYYQPQVDIKSEQIIGAEALIRWNHSKKGLISPLTFIPLAEETGLIVPVGEWVLQDACRRIKELQNDPLLPASFKKISVNISSKQFKQPSFTDDVIKIIKESKIEPSFLELEVTEGALISDLDEAIEKMDKLKKLGVGFSIDDFGTGYSSFTYLKKLPVDIIKIDKSFITNMHSDADDRVLTQTIIQMSQNLQLGLIAEGVEKIEHLNFLQEKGCQSYQGYFFSKPLPFNNFKELIHQSRVKPLELLRDTV